MAKWQDYFGKERNYNDNFDIPGKKVVFWEVLDIKQEQDILFRIISTNSEYTQGVRLAIDTGEGYLEIDGEKSKAFRLWETACPKEVRIKIRSSAGKLSVYNCFDRGPERGGVRECLDYCGMLVDEEPPVYRYHCEYQKINPDFNKLVFEIELL